MQRLRIEKACQLLIRSKDSVAAIARAVGYDDQKHFTELFRRYMGMPPRELRRTYRTGDRQGRFT